MPSAVGRVMGLVRMRGFGEGERVEVEGEGGPIQIEVIRSIMPTSKMFCRYIRHTEGAAHSCLVTSRGRWRND